LLVQSLGQLQHINPAISTCQVMNPGNIIVPVLGKMELNIHGRINHLRNDKSQIH